MTRHPSFDDGGEPDQRAADLLFFDTNWDWASRPSNFSAASMRSDHGEEALMLMQFV